MKVFGFACAAPNKFKFNNAVTDPEPVSTRMWNWLEPELAYSYFVLYRLTGDPIYREWGWELANAIEQHARVNGGYSGLKNVTAYPAVLEKGQNPVFLGGTLKVQLLKLKYLFEKLNIFTMFVSYSSSCTYCSARGAFIPWMSGYSTELDI